MTRPPDTLSHGELVAQLRRRNDELAALDAIGRLAAASPDLGRVLDEAGRIVQAQTGCAGLAVFTQAEGAAAIELLHQRGVPEELGARLGAFPVEPPPLFSRADIDWGARVKAFLEDRRKAVKVIWPHEIAPGSAGMLEIFQSNLKALNEADLMVALLDGSQVDDGTAWEVGFFFCQGKKVLGLRTDLRRAGEMEGERVNLMIECPCHSISESLEELLDRLQRLIY